METTRLLLSCPDRPGIVARVAGFLADNERNIIDADQHSTDEGRLFMRLVFESAPEAERTVLYERFASEVAEPLAMEHHFAEAGRMARVALMASREDHCLLDLLWRFRSGELPGEPLLVISNHPDHEAAVKSFGLPYHHIPVSAGSKRDAETASLELLRGEADLVVLARYMQILSAAPRSTSTTASCRRSPAPIPTTAPGSAG
jgi:formyltetrahydrofolate deformylase